MDKNSTTPKWCIRRVPSSVVDKSELVSLISTASAIQPDTYTPESFQDLTDAITTAQSVVDNADATQEEVNAQLVALQSAIDSLVTV